MHRRSLIAPLLAVSALAAALVVPAATFAADATATTTTTTTATTCPATHWPVAFQGTPTRLRAGAAGGDYIWHDANGWHLRVTHAGTRRVVFSGVIVASQPMTVTPVALETSDTWKLSADGKTLTYRFTNYGRIDGLDLTTACAQRLSFYGAMDGLRLPTWRIWVGHYDRHPLSNRFVVVKLR